MKVSLGTLKGKNEELAAFLEPRVGTKPSVSADSIEIEDSGVREGVHPRQVKTYIKRFLYMNGVRKNYRVFVAGKELTIQEIELGEKEKKEEEKKPPEAPAKPEEPAAEAPAEPEPEEAAEKEEAPKPKKAAAKRPRARKKKTAEAD